MKTESKAQIQAILALLEKRHPAVCDALANARASLPAHHAEALSEVITTNIVGTVNTNAVAVVAALQSEIEAA